MINDAHLNTMCDEQKHSKPMKRRQPRDQIFDQISLLDTALLPLRVVAVHKCNTVASTCLSIVPSKRGPPLVVRVDKADLVRQDVSPQCRDQNSLFTVRLSNHRVQSTQRSSDSLLFVIPPRPAVLLFVVYKSSITVLASVVCYVAAPMARVPRRHTR